MLLKTFQVQAALAFTHCHRAQEAVVSEGLSLNKHEITFNHKFNVNECNQVIRMCSGMIFTTCINALIMLCEIMLKILIELCKKKGTVQQKQMILKFNILITSTFHL